jgi:hypothetical protein
MDVLTERCEDTGKIIRALSIYKTMGEHVGSGNRNQEKKYTSEVVLINDATTAQIITEI